MLGRIGMTLHPRAKYARAAASMGFSVLSPDDEIISHLLSSVWVGTKQGLALGNGQQKGVLSGFIPSWEVLSGLVSALLAMRPQ